MALAPRNSHEKVYIDMSIIVIDVKKCNCIEQAYALWSDSFHKE